MQKSLECCIGKVTLLVRRKNEILDFLFPLAVVFGVDLLLRYLGKRTTVTRVTIRSGFVANSIANKELLYTGSWIGFLIDLRKETSFKGLVFIRKCPSNWTQRSIERIRNQWNFPFF